MTPPNLVSSIVIARRDALEYQEELEILLFIARQGADLMNARPSSIERLQGRRPESFIAMLEDAAACARGEQSADYPMIHGFGAVAIWAGLEDAVTTLLEIWLTFEPSALETAVRTKKLQKFEVPLVEFLALDEEDRPAYILEIIERKQAAALKPGLGRFDGLLDTFGLAYVVPKNDRDALFELSQVRNCIVHRRGIADKRLVEMCPNLGLQRGDRLMIGTRKCFDYSDAARNYIASLFDNAEAKAKGRTYTPPQ